MKKVYYNTKKKNNLIMSLHSIQRCNQRGIRSNDLSLINEEGTHFNSSHHKQMKEVFFTRKGKKRFVSQINCKIRNLEILRNKQVCKKDIKSINENICLLKKKLQKSDKLEGKFMVIANNKVVTCYSKYKKNNLRKYLTKHKSRKFIK